MSEQFLFSPSTTSLARSNQFDVPMLPGMRRSAVPRRTYYGKKQAFEFHSGVCVEKPIRPQSAGASLMRSSVSQGSLQSLSLSSAASHTSNQSTYSARRQELYRQLDELNREERDTLNESMVQLRADSKLRRPHSAISAASRLGASSTATGAGLGPSTHYAKFEPSWVKLDRKVLRFYGYFQESVHESAVENYRIRKCVIYYYLEDNSVRIDEPKRENSGLPQGVFLKRNRAFKEDNSLFLPQDFAIGNNVMLYGRCYRIVGCDGATRAYFEEALESPQPDALPYPDDPVDVLAKSQVQTSAPPALMAKPPDKLGRFLQFDRQVLRFDAVWDDRDINPSGCRHDYIVHFFLSDGTIELRETMKANSGRDPFPMLLSRCRLPRKLGGDGRPVHFTDGLGDYVTDAMLRCGEYIDVYSRSVLLTNCDGFTVRYYKQRYGIDQVHIEVPETPRETFELAVPPYEPCCFGGEVDSAGSCGLTLQPKPFRKDYARYVRNEGKVLRFRAKLVHQTAEDAGRTFVVSFFLSDDTTSVYEPPQRNSGVIGGRFLERARYKFTDGDGKLRWIRGTDFQKGATMCFATERGARSPEFELLGCDSATRRIMANDTDEFPHGDADTVLQNTALILIDKGVPYRKMLCGADRSDSGWISCTDFVRLANSWKSTLQLSDDELSAGDISELTHYFDREDNDRFDYNEFCDMIATRAPSIVVNEDRLKGVEAKLLAAIRNKTQSRGSRGISLRKVFRDADKDKSGSITESEFRDMLHGLGIQVEDSELAMLMLKYDTDGEGTINYNEFCNAVYEVDFGTNEAYQSGKQKWERSRQGMSEAQRKMLTPTMRQYRERMRKAQQAQDSNAELELVMKKFSANFFSRKAALRKNFLAFDMNGNGSITADEFLQALQATNNNFTQRDKTALVKHFFPDPNNEIEYDTFMNMFFRQDVSMASKIADIAGR